MVQSLIFRNASIHNIISISAKKDLFMQTIIYTNNKREGSNYQVDRIVFSEGVDVAQLIETEMERSNISHIHFWFVRENVNRMQDTKEESLLINFGKYLIENKDGDFTFQYVVQRYQESKQKKQVKNNVVDRQRNFRVTESSDSMIQKMNNSRQQKSELFRQEIIKEEIKFTHFKQFSIFVKKQLQSNIDDEIIKKYLFKTKTQRIGVSFFQVNQKNLIQKIIDQDCNQVFNAKLHYRKISTIHPEDYQKNRKKTVVIQQPIQLYHRVILYLFSHAQKCEDNRQQKRKKTYQSSSPPQKNLSIQALEQWKLQQQTQSLIKYQKECELIAQQIENQKIIFRNKIKLIQNYIGDTINVDKLFQEEQDIQANNMMVQQMSNTVTSSAPFKKIPLLARRLSVTPMISQALTNNLQKLAKFNSTTNNSSFLNVSEFKRLKDLSQAMRSIDSTIYQQNKKIEQLKNKAKELTKLKQEVLFKNAKQFNAIKKQILELTNEIDRKQKQIEEKKKAGQFHKYLQYKNKEPSQKARQILEEHIKFVSLHQKPQTFDHHDYVQYQYQQFKDLQQKSTIQSQHHRKQFKEIINSSMLKFRDKKIKQAEKTKQKIRNQSMEDFGYSTSPLGACSKLKTQNFDEEMCRQQSLPDLERQLLQLYRYYSKNSQIINTAHKEIGNFKCLQQNDMVHAKKTLDHHHQHRTLKSTDFQSKLQKILNLDDFPILKNLLDFEDVDIATAVQVPSQKNQSAPQTLFPNDFFEFMINSNKPKPAKQGSMELSRRSSLKDTEGERTEPIIIPKPVVQQNFKNRVSFQKADLKNASTFKRMTIQEAINPSSLVKKVRMNDTRDYR